VARPDASQISDAQTVQWRARGEFARQAFGVSADRDQQVIEVVRQSRRRSARTTPCGSPGQLHLKARCSLTSRSLPAQCGDLSTVVRTPRTTHEASITSPSPRRILHSTGPARPLATYAGRQRIEHQRIGDVVDQRTACND
jgi:hypothetical protein